MTMGWAPICDVESNPPLVWMFVGGTLIGAGPMTHFVVRHRKEGIGQKTLAAVLFLLTAACIPLMMLVSSTAYVPVLATLALVLIALVPRWV